MALRSDQLGRVLAGRYRLETPLGSGASAQVFLAADLRLERQVAVKLLHPGLAYDEGFLRRLRLEARVVASLNHPNVLRVYDVGEDGGSAFLVTEFLAGGSLRELLDTGRRLTLAQATSIGAAAASGLGYAHRRGLVHRDIKPANLLFDEDARVRIGDFGLARALAEAAWTEPLGAVLGTARYASPEQAEGAVLDDRSDVYALGLVLYEAVVGRVPFAADTTLSTLAARIGATLPEADELGPLYPLLTRAAAPERAERFDAESFSLELTRLERLLPPPAPLPLKAEITPVGHEEVSKADLAQPDDITVMGGDPDSGLALEEKNRSRRREAATRPGRVVWRSALVLVALAVLCLVALFVDRFVIYSHRVPSLRGVSLTSARETSKKDGLVLVLSAHEHSATLAAGEIISQSPRPGTAVRARSDVRVVVSTGHEPVRIEAVVGQPATVGERLLTLAHFRVQTTEIYSESVPSGHIVAERPGSGLVPYGSVVALSVSKGPAPVTIPDLVGESFSSAHAQLVTLRLRPVESLSYSSSVPAGTVISSDPASGATGIAVGTSVTVTVSRGPQLVVVPTVAGQSVDAAIAALQSAGLSVTEEIGPPFATEAVTTDPAPGASVPINSSVTLYVS